MTGRRRLLVTIVGIVVVATCLFIYQLPDFPGLPQIVPSAGRLLSHVPIDDEMPKQTAIHAERRHHLKRHCEDRAHYFYAKDVKSSGDFIVDHKHHVIYCFVPKNGCSFWKRVFSVLDGNHNDTVVFNLSSVHIHTGGNRQFNVLGKDNFIQKYHTFRSSQKMMFARDPYERLFSGYIDKIFSPCSLTSEVEKVVSNFGTSRRDRKCHTGATFTEFVRYVTNTRGIGVNDHFSKQYTKCHPCHVDYDFIGKVETIHEDANFILRSLSVDPDAVFGPDEAFEENSDVNILDDVAKRSFDRCRGWLSRDCLSPYDMMLRLWVTFQIRGYLSIHVPMPLSRKEAKTTTLKQFQTLARAAYKKSGDHSVVKQQRKLALLEAFHGVSRPLLGKLESYMAEDCGLFGYDCSVDSRFNVSMKPKPLFRFDEILFPEKT